MLAQATLLGVSPEFRDLMLFLRLYESAYLVLKEERGAKCAQKPQ